MVEKTEEQKKAAAFSRRKTLAKKKIAELKHDMKVYSELSPAKFNKELREGTTEIFEKYSDVFAELYKDELVAELKEMKSKEKK